MKMDNNTQNVLITIVLSITIMFISSKIVNYFKDYDEKVKTVNRYEYILKFPDGRTIKQTKDEEDFFDEENKGF
jgi:hypothetical protein